LAVIANRKKGEEIMKRKKEEAQESHGRDTIKKQKANMKGKGVKGGRGSKPKAKAR